MYHREKKFTNITYNSVKIVTAYRFYVKLIEKSLIVTDFLSNFKTSQ